MAAPAVDDAFEDLYASYGREVYRYALALLRNPAEAEDVTQTTFLNAYRALRAGQRPRRPHNWLIAITHNVCRSRVRFAMRRPKEVPLDDVVEQLAVPEAERPNVRELMRTIRRLPFNQRAAITMRELEGRSYVDIAETLGVTVPAAEALIGRARRTLRAHAAAFRGLLLLPLPRSLRKLAENGEAAGGAVGGAAAAKVVALIVIGAVGGGVGVAAGGSDPPSVQAVPRAAAHELAARDAQGSPTGVAVGAPLVGTSSTAAARAAQQETQLAQLPPGATAVAATAQTGAVPAPGGGGPTVASVPGTTAAAAEVTSAAGTTVGTVGTTVTTAVAQVTQAITTVAAHLPTVTTPTVTTPPATTPRVTTPTVTTPTVTTPVTTVPPVTAPTVTVPSVTVPTVTIP